MTRDLSKKQFDAACARHDFTAQFMGYYDVGNGWHVNKFNAGDRRRDQLAYLIRKSGDAAAKAEEVRA